MTPASVSFKRRVRCRVFEQMMLRSVGSRCGFAVSFFDADMELCPITCCALSIVSWADIACLTIEVTMARHAIRWDGRALN